MKQPEALRLADLIDNDLKKAAHHEEAAAELRRLHAVNAELLEALSLIASDDVDFAWSRLIARAAIAKAGGEA